MMQVAGTEPSSLRVDPEGVEFQQKWQQVRQGCEAILKTDWTDHSQKIQNSTLVLLYTHVYRLASNPGRNVPGLVKGGSETVSGKDAQSTQVLVLYYLLREMLKTHLDLRVKPAICREGDANILQSYLKQWENFVVALELISFIFRYLHNHWNKLGLPAGHVTTTTKPLGLMLWGDLIVISFKASLESSLLAIIRDDREMERDVSAVRRVLQTLTVLGSHDSRRQAALSEVFEAPFVKSTTKYYEEKAQLELQSLNVEQYVEKALSWTELELKRVERYSSERSSIPQHTKRTLLHTLVESRLEVLFAPIERLLQLESDDCKLRLSKFYSLIKPSDLCVAKLAENLKRRVELEGLQTISAHSAEITKDGPLFVVCVLDVYRKFKNLVENEFGGNAVLIKAMKDGAGLFINKNTVFKSDVCAEYLARFASSLVKPSQQLEADFEDSMKELVEIFELFDDRDYYQSTYWNLMCQRLIQGNVKEDNERRAIALFRHVSGREFTYKWERMLADAVEHKKELQEAYEQVPERQRFAFELHPLVLASAWWPLKNEGPFVPMTGCIGEVLRSFESFYKAKLGGRSLKWLGQLSNGTVLAKYGTDLYTFTVSAWQWELLNFFNNPTRTAISFKELSDLTETTDTQMLQRAILPLLTQQVLTFHDNTEKNIEKHRYVLNEKFTSKKRRIAFNIASTPDGSSGKGIAAAEGAAGPSAAIAQQVQDERRHAIQAAIVRIMKSRRKATYSELVAEVSSILETYRIRVTPQDIKQNLETLIDKEFVERSPQDANTFVYLT